MDPQVQHRIIDAIDISQDSVALEIGAGPGNMTRLLAERVNRLISVEIDERLASNLQQAFAGNSRVEIIHDDFLNLSIPSLASHASDRKLTIFGNLPYYITTPILMKLFDSHDFIRRIVVMMQYEVAQRLTAAPGETEYGLLSVTAQYFSIPKLLFKIPPGAFNPPPKVTSALVGLNIKSRAKELGIFNEAQFFKWMRAAFEQKRKTLGNNWKSLVPTEAISEALIRSCLDPRVRAQDLSLSQLAKLYCALGSGN